jgi:hypothetical protein
MTETKLLIEAVAQTLQDHFEQFHGITLNASDWDAAAIAALKSGGLIAEPVDVKRLAARRAVADFFGKPDEGVISEHCLEVELVMRGMELAEPKPLTREKLRDLVKIALHETGAVVEYDDFLLSSPVGPAREADAFVEKLYVALVEQMK